MAAEPTRRAIVVGPKAHELRRFVGSASWAVLEEMMQVATGPSDRLVAEVSIRSLAASLGVAKDTVARAVRRLRDAAAGAFWGRAVRDLDEGAVCQAVRRPSIGYGPGRRAAR